MSGRLHINRPRGYYLGQVRAPGCRLWSNVTGRCKTAQTAISKAVLKTHYRWKARALFIDTSGYYEPHVSIEARWP